MDPLNLVNLSWELSVLSRAVHYGNLSGAAMHVGVSQPQLSRIIAKIESELGVVLLDRTVRRKSGWLPVAHKLSEIYLDQSRRLSEEIQNVIHSTEPESLRLGTLEGLVPMAMTLGKVLLEQKRLRVLELNVYDLNQLEEMFIAGDLDLIFTSREPGRKKFRFMRVLGFQTLELVQTGSPIQVKSIFEFRALPPGKPRKEKFLVSNSLGVRKEWLERFGGEGVLPSEIRKQPSKRPGNSVILLGSERLSRSLWDQLVEITF